MRIATIPKPYKDVDALLVGAGGAAYEAMIAAAKPAPAWMIDNIESHGYELETPEGQQDAADAMLSTLLSLPLIERTAYVRQLAERLELGEVEMRRALNDAYARNGGEKAFRNVTRDDPERRASLDIP